MRRQVLIVSLWVFICILGHSFAYAKLLNPQGPVYQDIPSFLKARKLSNLEEYVNWMQANITYKADNNIKDDWASPLITLNSRTGDCEDIAFLNAEVLKHFGIKTRVLAYGKGHEAHVIALFILNGKYYIFDNTKFYKDISAPSLKEIFLYLVKKQDAQYLLEIFHPRKLQVLYVYQKNKIS